MRLCGGTKSSCSILAGVCVCGEWSLGMRLCNGASNCVCVWGAGGGGGGDYSYMYIVCWKASINVMTA